jgi:ParB family transcriptional regulator, chromosome partitioning protein
MTKMKPIDFGALNLDRKLSMTAEVLVLDVNDVVPDPANVRREIDETKIAELAASLIERGQLQPIVVQPQGDDGKYQICYGERRWRACMMAGLKVQAIIDTKGDTANRDIDQFVENDQREGLSNSALAAFVTAKLASGMKVTELAKQIGRDQAIVSRIASLASAPEFLRDKIDTLPIRTAALLVQASKVDDTATERFVEEAGADTLTVAVCTTFLRSLTQPVAEVETPNAPAPQTSDEAAQEEEQAQDIAVDASDEPVASKLPATDASTVSRFKEYASKPAMGLVTMVHDGKRAIVMDALLHFPDEAEPRRVFFQPPAA